MAWIPVASSPQLGVCWVGCRVQCPSDVCVAQYNGHVPVPPSGSSGTVLGSPFKAHRKGEGLLLGATGPSYLEKARPWHRFSKLGHRGHEGQVGL